tara:strand:- start:337 stop:1941 length:1605 start_codon:yes stop_codon:yes gene_type:complete
MNQYNPTISHQFYNQFIEEYVKEEEMVYKINSNNGIETGYDEDNKLLFKLIPNCFKSKKFQSNDLYNLLIKDIDENESKIYNTNNSSHIESYINNISNLLAEYSPKHYNKNKEFLYNKKSIGTSVFNITTFSKNLNKSINIDPGDYQEGIGVISCMGDFVGGDICLPNYKIQLKLKPTDLLLININRHYCNLPTTKGNRIECVSYFNQNITEYNNDIKYKIFIKSNQEELIKYLQEQNISDNKIYITDYNKTLRFDGVNVLDREAEDYFPSNMPLLYFNSIEPFNKTLNLDKYILSIFSNLYETKNNEKNWGNNFFTLNIPQQENISTLITYKTPTILKNIESWKKLGYKVNVYSYNNLEGCLNASTICEKGDLYYFAIQLLRLKETIFLAEDMLLLKKIPPNPIILSNENNRSNKSQPSIGILKMPRDHKFLNDISKFLNKNPNLTENRRRFEKGLQYFALHKYILTPNYFCKLNRVYSKSLFIDYEKYKKQPVKYQLNIPLVETFKNCIGLRVYNINTHPEKNSLYSILSAF